MKFFLIGFICGLGLALWMLRKSLFEIRDYDKEMPDIGDLQ